MPVKIDIDAIKIFTKSTQELPVLKRKSVFRLAHFWKLLKPKDLELLLTYEFTRQQPQGRVTSFKKFVVRKKLFLFHIDPKI